MTAHLFKYNSDPVQQYVVSSDGEKSLQSEDEQSSPSSISCAEEEPNCQPLQKSSVEQGAQMKMKTKIWNVILQNCTVALLDVDRSLVHVSSLYAQT
jgi:hypothetical protein